MPYDAPDYTTVLWENGKPYWRTASGKKTFIPPLVAAQMRDNPEVQAWAAKQGVTIDYQTDPETGQVTVGPGGVENHAAPGGSLFRERGQWNSETGEWDRPINWNNIAVMGVGGAMAAPFIVPALAAAGGAGGGAGAGAATGAVLPSTTIAPLAGALPAGLASGSSAAALGLGGSLAGGAAAGGAAAGGAAAGGGAGAGAGGAASGVAPGVVPASGVVPGAAPAVLPSTQLAPLAGATPAGLTSGSSAALSGATLPGAGGASTLSRVAKAANTARDIGSSVSNASSAAGANRRLDAGIGQNAQRTYEVSLMDRADEEMKQRRNAGRDVYRSNFFRTEQPGPYSAKPQPAITPELRGQLTELERQGIARLAKEPEYDSTKFKPLTEREIEDAGTLEKVGSWVGPTLSAVGAASKYFG